MILWVREAFQLWREGWDRTGHVIYKGGLCDLEGNTFESDELGKWTPAIHMPKAFCRTRLELTGVRAERLQEITQLDALHEGCEGPDHKARFYQLWESIHGTGTWDCNPWVWVLGFMPVRS